MRPFSRERSTLAAFVIVASIAASVQACGGSATEIIGRTDTPAFALTVAAPVVSVAAGGTAVTSIRVERTGGLVSTITYSVTGAPAGVAVIVASTSVPDSSTLTITASPAIAAGTYSIVVNATAAGALPQQVMLAVTVTAAVPAGSPAVNFVVAGAHTCALTSAGAAHCWGYNANGQLGNNDTAIVNPTPVATVGGLEFQSLSVSKVQDVTCGVTPDGAAYCWGENNEGQLGDGTTTRRLTPTPVAGGLTFKSVAVGSGHTCGVATNGTAYCWGFSPNGAFGDGSVGLRLTPAVAAPGMSFQSIVGGNDFTCGLTQAGAAFCWGLGGAGQLGDGKATTSTTPVAVSGGLTFRSLAAGGITVCGLTIAGKIYCWGNNFYGTVGDGSSATEDGTTRRAAPVGVAGNLTFRSLSAGYQTMCGVTDSGAGYCWGYNFGAIGDGTTDHRSSPTAVAGGLAFQSIASGTGYGCGLTTNNAVYCWGDNSNGALGDGSIRSHLTPEPVRWP
jgi:alpha-tubulin suppressor-like RCC1 family protein